MKKAPIKAYYRAFLSSQEFLLNYVHMSFPIDIHALIKRFDNVFLRTKRQYKDWCAKAGQTPTSDIQDAKCFYYADIGAYLIVYDEKKPPQRIRFTLAHELAHVYLPHLNNRTTELARGGLSDIEYSILEGEVNTFAGNLLAPPILIEKHHIKLQRMNEAYIKNIFNLSEPAAGLRFRDYITWKNLNKTETEIQILHKHQQGHIPPNLVNKRYKIKAIQFSRQATAEYANEIIDSNIEFPSFHPNKSNQLNI